MTYKLAYFERWIDPVAETILREVPNLELAKLSYESPEEQNWTLLESAQYYQISPGTEIRHPWRADDHFLDRAPALLAICSTGSGYDTIDVDACTRRGILVCNQAGSNNVSVAEHAVGLMLSVCKNMGRYDRLMRVRSFEGRFDFPGSELTGKTIGIVGLGNIGAELARICSSGFRMQTLAFDPYLSAEEISSRGAEKVDFADLLQLSDYVSLNCPLTRETRGMMGATEFAAMKPSAIFVTTARGGIHDERALKDALDAGVIAGAGIDVFDQEPPSMDHLLMSCENVVVTPHIAGLTQEAMYRMASSAAEQWLDIAAGSRPPRLVNPDAWPGYLQRLAKLEEASLA